VSPVIPTVRDAVREHDFGLMAQIHALKLQTSRFEVDRAGSFVAWQVATLHNQAWLAMTGQAQGHA
jgi:hypothetical protein